MSEEPGLTQQHTDRRTPPSTPQRPSHDGRTPGTGYKQRVDYSNSKEVQQQLEELDLIIAKRKQELSSLQKSGNKSAAHKRKSRRLMDSDSTPIKTIRNLEADLSLVDDAHKENHLENHVESLAALEEDVDPFSPSEGVGHGDSAETPHQQTAVPDPETTSESIQSDLRSADNASPLPSNSSVPNVDQGVHHEPSSVGHARVIIRSNIESISLPPTPMLETFPSSAPRVEATAIQHLMESAADFFAGTPPDTSFSHFDDDVIMTEPPIDQVAILDTSDIDKESVASSQKSATLTYQLAQVQQVNDSQLHNHDDEDADDDHDAASFTSSDSDPENSLMVHPVTYTVANISDHMDVEHATVRFGGSEYHDVHLKIDSLADTGMDLHLPEGQPVQDVSTTVAAAESNSSFSSAEKALQESADSFFLGESMAYVSDDTMSSLDEEAGGDASLMMQDASEVSASKIRYGSRRSGAHQHRHSAKKSPNSQTNGSGQKKQQSQHATPASANSSLLLNPQTPSSSFIARITQASADLIREHHPHSPTGAHGSDSLASLEKDAKALHRHLSIYMLKNALLKEEVLQITKLSEDKFHEVLLHRKRLEGERDKCLHDISKLQEELLAEKEELLFVRGQLQSKSARVVDLEAELLASQRLMGSLQKEARLWRSQPTTPTQPTSAQKPFQLSPPNSSSSLPQVQQQQQQQPQVQLYEELPPWQALLRVLDQLEYAAHPQEKERLQNYVRAAMQDKEALEAQVSSLQEQLHASAEASSALRSQVVDTETRAELEVGRMAVELEEMHAQMETVLQERRELLETVQQLREDLKHKDSTLFELEVQHEQFMRDYETMERLLQELQEKQQEKSVEVQEVVRVTIVSKESDLKHVLAEHHLNSMTLSNSNTSSSSSSSSNSNNKLSAKEKEQQALLAPQMRAIFRRNPRVFVAQRTGGFCGGFMMFVMSLAVVLLAVLCVKLQFNLMLFTEDEDVITQLLGLRWAY